MNLASAKTRLILSMFIFGTIGIFVRYIPLPSSVIAFARGLSGMLFLLLIMLVKRSKASFSAVKGNFPFLCLSGAALGGNWILLFEAYRYTTVATATLCYYLAPVFVILASPVILKEKLPAKKAACVFVAFAGMIFVSGAPQNRLPPAGEMKGILFGVGAAALYSCLILLNKKIRDVPAYDKTIVQLGAAAVTVLPYILITEDVARLEFSPIPTGLLLVVGIVHTGIAYALYFGSMKDLKAQTVAIFSYIDPVVAILLSAVVLKEDIGVMGIIGAVMVLGPALVSELPERKTSQGPQGQ